MKKKLSKFLSCFLLAAAVIFLAVNNVSAADYDKSFSYKGDVQTYTVPVSGYYKLEVWGAKGGDVYNRVGGNGGYSVGYVYLTEGQNLYVVTGGAGIYNNGEYGDGNNYVKGGYNGGADSGLNGGPGYGGSGGGATHIALGVNRGELKNYVNNKSEILIVAGGGGGAEHGGRYIAYRPTDDDDGALYADCNGGAGGGLEGGRSSGAQDWELGGLSAGYGGTQTRGGMMHVNNKPSDKPAGFGKGGCNTYYSAGGGGGWYGGAASMLGGGGGSGYIGGCLSTLEYRGNTYTSSTAAGNNSGNGKAAITYLGPVCYRQTVQVSYENADGTFTEYEDAVTEDYEEGSTFTWKREADGTYRETDEISYTVTEAKTTQVTVYRQQYTLTLEKTNGIDTVTGEGEYRAGQTVNIEAAVKEGYEFGGWSDSETLIGTESTYEFEMPANDLRYRAVTVPIEYSITYYLQGGADGGKNPESYTAESEDIVLKQPTKRGYSFLGWSESNGSSYQKSVTIPKGSTKDRVYWANWEEDVPEDEGSILPSPAPTPASTPTPKRTPADDGSNAADEEAEAEEPKLIQMPSVDHAAPAPVIKEEGTINIPEKNVGVSNFDRSDNIFGKIAAAAAGFDIIGGAMIFFVLFWFFRKCKIYDARTEELIGRTVIRKDRRGMYWVRISDAVYEMAGTKIYIVLGKNFVRSYPEKLLKISICGKEFYRQIQEKVDLQYE